MKIKPPISVPLLLLIYSVFEEFSKVIFKMHTKSTNTFVGVQVPTSANPKSDKGNENHLKRCLP